MWNDLMQRPAVTQKALDSRTHITYNPDDERFYVEELVKYTDASDGQIYREWETVRTFQGTWKGWDNAKAFAKRLSNGDGP